MISMFQGKALMSSPLLHTTTLDLLHTDMLSCAHQSSLTPGNAFKSLICLLSPDTDCSHSSPFPHLHYIFVCQGDIANYSVTHSTFSPSNSFMCKYTWKWIICLVQGFFLLKYNKTRSFLRLVLGSLLLPRVMVILLLNRTCRCRICMSSRLLHTSLPSVLGTWLTRYKCCAWSMQAVPMPCTHSYHQGILILEIPSLLLEPPWVSQSPWSCSACLWMLAAATILSWSLHVILRYLPYSLNIMKWNLCLYKFLSLNFPSQNCPVWVGLLRHN